MTKNEQAITLRFIQEGASLTTRVDFDPPIVGVDNPDYAAMTDDQKAIQNYAGHVTNKIMSALQDEQEPEG